MAVDIMIEVENKPGELAKLAAAVSDAGVNLAAATFTGNGDSAQLHILVKHAEPVRHALAITHADLHPVEREVVVVEIGEQPGIAGRPGPRDRRRRCQHRHRLRRHQQPRRVPQRRHGRPAQGTARHATHLH